MLGGRCTRNAPSSCSLINPPFSPLQRDRYVTLTRKRKAIKSNKKTRPVRDVLTQRSLGSRDPFLNRPLVPVSIERITSKLSGSDEFIHFFWRLDEAIRQNVIGCTKRWPIDPIHWLLHRTDRGTLVPCNSPELVNDVAKL